MRKELLALSCILLIMNCLELKAQILPPANVDPGAVGRVNNENLFKNIAKQTEKKPQEEILNTTESKEQNPIEVHIEKFQLNQVAFTGNTIFKSETLENLFKDLLGKDISVEDMSKLLDEITNLYRSKGYITSFAYIPEQEIKDGELKIAIFEGKIGKINVQGAKWTRSNYFKNNIFKANNFEKSKVFNVNDLQRSLQEINNKEYLKGQVTLQKGEEPATTDIILDVKDRFPLKLGASWDNLGRDLIGVQRANIFVADNNLTGFGDSLYGGVSLATRTFGVSSGYSLPIGPYGTEFRFGYSFSNVNVGGSFEQLKIHGSSHMFSPSLVQPIYKGNNFNLTSNISFDLSHSRTTLLNFMDLQNYDLRVLRCGLNAIKEESSGRWLASGDISTGIPLLGATTKSGFGVGSSKFVKLSTNLIRAQALPFKTTGIFRVSGQFSPDALLAPEQLQLGGTYTVRGYNEGLLLGDIGYNASMELRRPVPFLPDLSIPYWKGKKATINLKDRIQFAAFYDQGFAKAIHQNTPTTYVNFLQSIGIGLRCQLTKFLTANIDMGIPLGKKRSADQDAVKIHFGLSSNFF